MSELNRLQINPSLLEKLQVLAKKHNSSIEEEIRSILENKIKETEITQSDLVKTSNQGENKMKSTQSSVNDQGGFGCARELIIIPSDFDEPIEDFSDYI